MTNTIDPTRELVMSRVYRAPRDLILKMWSDPDMLTHWWGPFGFSTTTHEMDFRPGGIWRFTMHGPDGTDYANLITYVKASADEIAYNHGGPQHEVEFSVQVTFEDVEPGQTRMNFRMTFPTPEERKRVVDTFGADKGLVATITRLDVLLGDVQSEADPFTMHISLPSPTEIKMVRSFRAPRALVFRAHTDPELIRQWQGPHGYKFTECSFDARPGGKWSFTQVDPDGNAFEFFGEVLEIVPPERCVSTFQMVGFPGIQTNSSIFEESNGITKLTIISSYDTEADRDNMLNSGMEWGMNQGYERLDAILAKD